MNKRVLFTDLDGTLLDDNKDITPGNQAAIDEALEKGHVIVISTGRPLASAYAQAQNLGLTKKGCYAITFNGSQIYDSYHKTTLYGKALPKEIVKPIFDAAREAGIHIQTYNDEYILTEFEREELLRYTKHIHIPYQVVENIDTALTVDPYKLIAINFESHQKLVDFQDQVLSKYSDVIHSFFSNDNYLEIVPIGVSKGFAVEWMCDFLNIPIENSVAAGDAQNDIAMLQAAHVGAVMCNAEDEIKAYGNYITTADNNHDGVAEIIRKFIIQE